MMRRFTKKTVFTLVSVLGILAVLLLNVGFSLLA